MTSTSHQRATPNELDGWATFQSQGESFTPPTLQKLGNLNAVQNGQTVKSSYIQNITRGNSSDRARAAYDAGLRISDAELLRLTLRHTSSQQREHSSDPLICSAETEKLDAINARKKHLNEYNLHKGNSIESYKNKELQEELIAAPASVLTPLLPPRLKTEFNISSGTVVESIRGTFDDFRTLTIEGGRVEIVSADNRRADMKFKYGSAQQFKPFPGQVCCLRGEEKRNVKDSSAETELPPAKLSPQICCPSKNKSGQCSSVTEPMQEKSQPDNEEKPKASPLLEKKAIVRPFDTRALKMKLKTKPPADDQNIFNCCLSIVGKRKVEINNCPMPELSDDGVIIKMHTVALGSSDVYLFDNGIDTYNGHSVLGHEGCGIVYKVGKNVRHLRPGDAVAIEPGIACGSCPYCKSGHYNLCPAMKFNGLLQTYCSHPAHFCYKIPKDLDPIHAALTHPIAMALHACRKARVGVGSTVLVLGACPLGLSVVMVARAMGADKTIVIDTLEKNLKLANDLCADKTILLDSDVSTEQLANKVCSDLKANPNVVVDCYGCSRSVNLASLALKPGGFFVLAGCQADCASLPILAMLAKEISACASFRTSNEFANAMYLIESRRANAAKLITHKTEFCNAQEGFEWAVDEEKSGAIKVLINWPRTDKR